MTNYDRVKEFHTVFLAPVGSSPALISDDRADLRVELIREETEELIVALQTYDLVAIADALTDLLYVTYGAGIEHGIDLDETFREVHRSNMTKLDVDGKPIFREDGKILKGPKYEPPKLAEIIDGQKKRATILSQT